MFVCKYATLANFLCPYTECQLTGPPAQKPPSRLLPNAPLPSLSPPTECASAPFRPCVYLQGQERARCRSSGKHHHHHHHYHLVQSQKRPCGSMDGRPKTRKPPPAPVLSQNYLGDVDEADSGSLAEPRQRHVSLGAPGQGVRPAISDDSPDRADEARGGVALSQRH